MSAKLTLSVWKFDRKVVHDGEDNNYKFEKDGFKHTLVPLMEESTSWKTSSKTLLLEGNKFWYQMEKEVVSYVWSANQRQYFCTLKL